MKILIVVPNDSLGGAEQYLKMISKYHKGEEVTVFFLKKMIDSRWADLPSSISLKYLSTKSYVYGIISLVQKLSLRKTGDYDRIYSSHIYITGLLGILISLGLLKKKQFVARESTSVFRRFKGFKLLAYKFTYALGYRHIDLLICQTKFMKKQLLEGFPKVLKRTRVVVLENPIDLELIRKNENEAPEFTPPKNYLVSAGRLIPEKGFDILIRAFSSIRNHFPHLNLLILGEGPEKENLLQIVNEVHAEEYVHLPGKVNNVYPYFKKAIACVVSSRIEGFPNVLLQMMSQNKSVISTLCAGGIENIPGIVTIPTERQEALEMALQSVLNNRVEENRDVFDTFLAHRDISNFITRLEQSLEKTT